MCAAGCAKPDQAQREQPVYITVNGKVMEAKDDGGGIIYAPELLSLCRAFQLRADADPLDLGERRELTVEATEDTEKIAALVSYFAWDEPIFESDRQLRQLAEGWGLSSENRITAQWILDNTDLAAEIPEYLNDAEMLFIHNHTDSMYDKYILGTGDASASDGALSGSGGNID